MPQGVETYVDRGMATIEFTDRTLRGPSLRKLLDIGGPESIGVDTRSGRRWRYTVPEGNAREAGLIDGLVELPPRTPPKILPPTTPITREPDEAALPDETWKYDDIREWAIAEGITVAGIRTKADLLDAVRATQGRTITETDE